MQESPWLETWGQRGEGGRYSPPDWQVYENDGQSKLFELFLIALTDLKKSFGDYNSSFLLFLKMLINTLKRLLLHKNYYFCWFSAIALLARRRWCVMTKMRSSMSKLNRSHYLVEFQTWSSNGEIFDKNRWHWLRGAMGPALPPQPIFCRLSSFLSP